MPELVIKADLREALDRVTDKVCRDPTLRAAGMIAAAVALLGAMQALAPAQIVLMR